MVRKKWLHGTPSTPTPTTAESRPFPDPVQFFNQDSSSSQEASGVIKSCAFTPDGQSVVTATGSGSVKVGVVTACVCDGLVKLGSINSAGMMIGIYL